MEPGPQPPGTIVGVALLGWMEKQQAIRFLTEDCLFEPALSAGSAESLWLQSRERAASIPERACSAPQEVPLTPAEIDHAEKFLQYLSDLGMNGVKVIKVDPMQLVVVQYSIAVERAATYVGGSETDANWTATSLPLSSGSPPLEMTFTRRNLDTDIVIDLPHAEYIFGVNMGTAVDGATGLNGLRQGSFGPKELMGHVSTLRVNGRLAVGKGYHRLYARIAATEGRMPDRLSVVALEPGTMTAPAPQPNEEGAAIEESATGLNVFGSRPALLADFFTEGLVTQVYLRRKRYQLQISSRWVAVDAP